MIGKVFERIIFWSIITSLPILSDHSILSKNQNPDSIVLNSIVTAL